MEKEIIEQIFHLAWKAKFAASDEIARQALTDIADALASVLPVDHSKVGGEGTAETGDSHCAATSAVHSLERIALRLRVLSRDGMTPPQVKWIDDTRQIALAAIGRAESMTPPPEEPQGFAKFLTVADGVRLVRFAGKDEIKLVARRKGSSGNPNTLFEIDVDKSEKYASVCRDSKLLFEIKGASCGYNRIETIAVSALHCFLKYTHKRNSRRRRALKRRREGILTPEQELAETVKRQKEGM